MFFVYRGNTTREFSHKWKVITTESNITQIDNDMAQIWATRIDNANIFTLLENGTWTQITGGLIHVSVGKSGVWGVYSGVGTFLRWGVTSNAPFGTSWLGVDGPTKQIDSGSSGVVYGVNRWVIYGLRGPFLHYSLGERM